MVKAEIWKGGLPYEPDVRKLEEKYPNPEEDQVITHEDFEKLLSLTRGPGRYYGVIKSWQKRLFNLRNIDSQWIQGKGVKILGPADRLEVGESGIRRKLKQVKREVRRTGATPRERLNEMGQRHYDHTMMNAAKMLPALEEMRKQLSIDLAPVKSLPKPQFVKSTG